MRAVECVVPNCGHVHAERDSDLVATVLRHVREAHPEESFGADAAASLVEQASYADLKHGKKGEWLDSSSAATAHSNATTLDNL